MEFPTQFVAWLEHLRTMFWNACTGQPGFRSRDSAHEPPSPANSIDTFDPHDLVNVYDRFLRSDVVIKSKSTVTDSFHRIHASPQTQGASGVARALLACTPAPASFLRLASP